MIARKRLLMAVALATAVGLTVPSGAAAADTQPPSIPTGLKATSVTPKSISITWNASTDNVGVVGYRVFRNGTLVDTPTGRNSTLSALTCGTTYIVMVSAKDAAGNKSLPATRLLATAACPVATPECPSPATVLGLLLEHKITYGCNWPDGWAARQAVQSIRAYLSTRAIKLDTWRARRWHKEALEELDAATSQSGAWGTSGALQPNKYGASVLGRLHRVIRILHYHNAELFEVSKAEKWAITATVWYIVASEYNRHHRAGGTNAYDMKAARTAIERGDEDFFAANTYRAAGRYITGFRRLNQLF
jgi:hypothetical protein